MVGKSLKKLTFMGKSSISVEKTNGGVWEKGNQH